MKPFIFLFQVIEQILPTPKEPLKIITKFQFIDLKIVTLETYKTFHKANEFYHNCHLKSIMELSITIQMEVQFKRLSTYN